MIACFESLRNAVYANLPLWYTVPAVCVETSDVVTFITPGWPGWSHKPDGAAMNARLPSGLIARVVSPPVRGVAPPEDARQESVASISAALGLPTVILDTVSGLPASS